MQAAAEKMTPETEIRDIVKVWEKAAASKDLDTIMSLYAPDVRAFDAIARLQFKGKEAYKTHWEACLSMCQGAMIFEVHELDIAADDDLAFCHYLARCGGTGPDGETRSGWTRATVAFRRIGGRWLIVHEHFSAPFDPESGKAMLDLQP
jgi:uncharacterized protein (TIGR02246 family)